MADKLQKWTHAFLVEFYREIYRLKGWPESVGSQRPGVLGHITNEIVYSRLAPGVLEDLRERNPTGPDGRRPAKRHQWLGPDYGHPELEKHLIRITVMMEYAENWDDFMERVQAKWPKIGETRRLDLDG